MGGAGSRRKGAGYERLIAKRFTEWLGFQVSRTPSSGAYGTREGWDSLAGDLMFKGEFPFYCELKRRESFHLYDVISGTGTFWGWWDEASSGAKKSGKRPLLICKRNNREGMAFVAAEDSVNEALHGVACVRNGPVVGYPLSEFLTLNPKLL